ncbi:hypothetical protein BD289DRAFT_294128 [Coniella lustricola]|uniref:Methyltransferase domain-containing protein n=1 Tax=Coniella lustricola TaxID=2025994 RepID=A0A2T3A4X0_9PEZI|nr:hypothetical protein BD289DRAFT_294128 [Coniella lustricola]
MLAKIGLAGSSTWTGETRSGQSTIKPFKLLDHGCSLGVVAPVLMETVPREVLRESSVLCADVSEPLVDAVRVRSEEEGWVNTQARVLDAQDTGLPSESFTHVVSSLCFHLIPDSKAALKAMFQATTPRPTPLPQWGACSKSGVRSLKIKMAERKCWNSVGE